MTMASVPSSQDAGKSSKALSAPIAWELGMLVSGTSGSQAACALKSLQGE